MRAAASERLAVRVLAAAVAVQAPALPALAAEGAGGGLLWPTVNFVLLLAVLFVLARKPVRAYFEQRRTGIRSELQEAAELRRQAEERHAKWQRRIADLERELEDIRATARERAESEREHILADARRSAERIRRDATAAVEQELRRARRQLREEASELAVELAGTLLEQQVDDRDRERLLGEFIERVESPADRPRAGGNGGPS